MTALPDAGAWRALAQATVDGDVELAPGELECREFELARAAFDLRNPESEAPMVAAFLRFHQLGFEAFFQGASSVPMAIACRPQLAGMWMDGFDSARMAALAKRCDCDCSRRYRWGLGYEECPRRQSALNQKSLNRFTALKA